MDRQLLLGVIVAVLAVGGCSKSKSPPAAAATSSSSNATASGASHGSSNSGGANAADVSPAPTETHRPVTVDSTAGERQFAMLRESYEADRSRRTELAFPDETIEGALARPPGDLAGPPPAFPHGINPLRRDLARALPPPNAANPLREMPSEPRIAAGSAPPAMAEPPLPGSPAGGAAPPTDALFSPPAPFPASGNAPAAPALAVELPAEAAPSSSPPAALPEDSDFHLVEVFYGTDRQFAESAASGWQQAVRCFWPTGCSVFATICLALVATGRRSLVLGLVAFGGMGVSMGLAYQDTAQALIVVRHAGKEGAQYTAERSPGGRIERGVCEVTIPKTHAIGELESPSITRLEIREDAARHVVLQKTERLGDGRFYELMRQRVSQSSRSELFVFIHGFNVSFEDAARRTAQIHHDLQFDGAPIFFSWPAHDKFIFTYPADETNVAWSVPHLKQFLLEIVKESQARSINLIAHSMGNRALAAALREIELEMHDRAKLFNQVILAAPDIDADDFRNNIAPAMQRTAQRLTLYASARDDALLASQLVHRGPRAGDAGEGLVIVSGIDTIDVTAIDSSPWGHSYYGSSDPVLQDLQALISRAIPPRDRTWLSPAQRDGLTYWIFQPTRTAAADANSVR
jgi:esterase/lipase superfamily enzyme